MYQLDNLALDALEKDFLPLLARWSNENAFKSINVGKHKLSTKNIDAVFAQLPPTTHIVAIRMNTDLVGFCEFYHIDHFNKTVMINIYIDQHQQNFILYGFKLLHLICSYGFNVMGFNKLSTDVMLEHTSILNIFKQKSFKIEVHKRAHVMQNQSYKTVAELALLKSEFKS